MNKAIHNATLTKELLILIQLIVEIGCGRSTLASNHRSVSRFLRMQTSRRSKYRMLDPTIHNEDQFQLCSQTGRRQQTLRQNGVTRVLVPVSRDFRWVRRWEQSRASACSERSGHRRNYPGRTRWQSTEREWPGIWFRRWISSCLAHRLAQRRCWEASQWWPKRRKWLIHFA